MKFFDKLKAGLAKTKAAIFGQINDLFKSFVRIDEDMLDELEEVLICSDIGASTTMYILDELRERIREKRLTDPEDAKAELKEILLELVGDTCYRSKRRRQDHFDRKDGIRAQISGQEGPRLRG